MHQSFPLSHNIWSLGNIVECQIVISKRLYCNNLKFVSYSNQAYLYISSTELKMDIEKILFVCWQVYEWDHCTKDSGDCFFSSYSQATVSYRTYYLSYLRRYQLWNSFVLLFVEWLWMIFEYSLNLWLRSNILSYAESVDKSSSFLLF